MTARVDFLFDFGSPNAYLCHKVLPSIAARTGATFDYKPILLGGVFKATGNKSPIEAYAGVKAKLAYEDLEIRRFVERHAIAGFGMSPHFPINTLMLMRGAIAAERLGVFAPYVDAMFDLMWRAHRKMDDPAVVKQGLEETSLPADALIAEAQLPEVKQALVDATAAAVERGVFGAPTFFVGDAMYFGKDRLRDVEEAIDRQR